MAKVTDDIRKALQQLEEELWQAETRFDKVHMNQDFLCR